MAAIIYDTDLPHQHIEQFINSSIDLTENITENQRNKELVFLCVFCLIGFLLTFRVIWHIMDKTKVKREERHITINVCHLCGVTILTIGLTFIYYLQHLNVIGYGESCYWLSFDRSFATGTTPLLNYNIFYERTKENGTPPDVSLFPSRVLWIYFLTIVISIPSFFMVEHGVNTGSGLSSCIRVPLFQSSQVTAIYLLGRFAICYILPTAYMSAVIWKIRYVMQMQNIFNRQANLSRNTTTLPLCWIIADFLIFISSWIPIGFLYLLAGILGRQNDSTWLGKPAAVAAMWLIHLCYCILFPLMYLRGIENVSLVKICCCDFKIFCKPERQPVNIVSGRNIEENLEEVEL